MRMKKLESTVKLMKAQVSFTTSNQKEMRDKINNVIAYSMKVTKSNLLPEKEAAKTEGKPKSRKDTQLTFQVYSHLVK